MNTDWMSKAACREYDPKLFFKEEGSRNEPWLWGTAMRVCEGCPVRRQCLEYALFHERAGSINVGYGSFLNTVGRDKDEFKWEKFTVSSTPPVGVWGGTLAQQRHAKVIKHITLEDKNGRKECVQGRNCPGCRPLDEWVDLLLEGSTA